MEILSIGLTRVEINDLRMRCFIGVDEEEMLHRQDILVSVTLLFDGAQAIADSDVDGGVDYKAVVAALMPSIENERFAVLERLVHELLIKVMEFEAVRFARVKVERLLALRHTRSVAVTLTARRKQAELCSRVFK